MVLFSLIRIFASNMKKILLMTLAVVLFGTVCQAKMKGADDQTKSSEQVEAVDLGLSVKWEPKRVSIFFIPLRA